jgi:hypothetical protein
MITQAMRAILLANGNGDELGRLLGQQPHDPGLLLRILPGVSQTAVAPMTSNRRR